MFVVVCVSVVRYIDGVLSSLGQGTISKGKRTLVALSYVPAPTDMEIRRICLFRERVRWPAKLGFDQHDRLPDLHDNCPCGRLSVSEFVCLAAGGVGWDGMNGLACSARPVLTLEEGPFLPDEYLPRWWNEMNGPLPGGG